MPRARHRNIPRDCQIPVDFRFLMTQTWRKLEAEGRGRHRALCHAMKAELIKVEVAQKDRLDSPLLVQWKLYEGVCNHFWPGSVRPQDRPGQLNHRLRTVDKSIFALADTDDMSFEELVDCIQGNGGTSTRSENTLGGKRRARRPRRQSNSPQRNPAKLRPPRSLSSRPILAQGTAAPLVPKEQTTQANFGQPALAVWDDDINMIAISPSVAPITKPQAPTLSFACRQGWALGQTTTSISAAVTGHKLDNQTDKLPKDGPPDLVQSSNRGTVSFSRVPDGEVEAFLNSFLGSSKAKGEAMDQTKDSRS
ncbi:hypothetical protein F5Y07DRAFT_371675 [Xylaria sp. FL0933]|nr:hypothetical protein F5Y07DRAFT_371675 [Xylaria sp. FL0933]